MPRPKGVSAWNDTYYVQSYELARTGMSNRDIAGVLGVSISTFDNWLVKKLALKDALTKARTSPTGKGFSFRDYVYERLPEKLQEYWDKINACENSQNGIIRAESLLAHAGKDARQHLFVYAFVHCNFNPSEALKKVGITKKTLDNWINDDLDFKELMDQINWHKKNFFEEGLVRLVKEGDTAATLFANERVNRDRGYGRQTKVEIEGNIDHHHFEHQVNMEQLSEYLSVEALRELMAAIEKTKEPQKALPAPSQEATLPFNDIIEAEYIEVQHDERKEMGNNQQD